MPQEAKVSWWNTWGVLLATIGAIALVSCIVAAILFRAKYDSSVNSVRVSPAQHSDNMKDV